DWSRVDVWFCDERAVPPDDDASNYRLALETLAAPAGVPLAHVHRMSAESADLDAAARAYDDALAPAMDVAILGIGEDGHVASLFPGSPWLGERTRRVAPVLDAPKPPPRRMTVTPPVLERAARVLVLAVGEGKADATAAALAASGDPRRPPARLVRAREWFVDRAAARGI
ncbi:MAG: 6-phosphogluconolactonase, partial [Candidatus Eisenbacteria bacterium]|nr:6-phosphogluconolactonase [Candidatus Eisenbacteria bacterium]